MLDINEDSEHNYTRHMRGRIGQSFYITGRTEYRNFYWYRLTGADWWWRSDLLRRLDSNEITESDLIWGDMFETDA